MIAINDQYADGRDMSWLWDVDFSALPTVDAVTGQRAYDMALRLSYDQLHPAHCATDLDQSLAWLVEHQQAAGRPARGEQVLVQQAGP